MFVNRIVEEDGKFKVESEDGSRSFGTYDTREEAERRLAQVEMFKRENNTVMVNFTNTVNAADIRKETIDGDDHYIIPSATLPDNIVMNGGLYPAEEIEKGYKSLESAPAPLGHPKIDGKYVSARDIRAINQFHAGAYVRNVRREGGRVYHDTVVNIRVANQTEKGQELISAIEKREPIHSSTGVFLNQEMLPEPMIANEGPSKGKEYRWIARNLVHDHQAVLINETGAATPAEGVGLMVNGDQESEFKVFFNAVDTKDPDIPESWLSKIATAVTNMLKSDTNEPETIEVNAMSQLLKDKLTALQVNFEDDATEAELLALHTEAILASNQVDVEKLTKDITEKVTKAMTANAEKAERETLVAKILETNKDMTAEDLEGCSIAALKKMSAPVTNWRTTGFAQPSVNTDKSDHNVDLNAMMGGE